METLIIISMIIVYFLLWYIVYKIIKKDNKILNKTNFDILESIGEQVEKQGYFDPRGKKCAYDDCEYPDIGEVGMVLDNYCEKVVIIPDIDDEMDEDRTKYYHLDCYLKLCLELIINGDFTVEQIKNFLKSWSEKP